MRVGLQLPSFSWPGGPEAIAGRLVEIAQAAEASGFASLWVMDHYFQLGEDTWLGPADQPMLEAYTTLGYLAHATDRIMLGPLVCNVMARHPGVMVKTATTFDVLAGGRTYLGLGAGWYRREALGIGIPWPSRRERYKRLEEALQLTHAVWRGSREPFEGRHYRAAEPINNPPPVARPRPRIMVGGNGPRRTMTLVARYADASNFGVPDPGESRRLVDTIHRFCDEIGRDPAEIEMTSLLEVDLRPGQMSTADVVARIRAQADEGVEHVIVNMPDVHDLRYIDMFRRDVLPAVGDMAPPSDADTR
jgi:F420-dependent oxidoreductase-like protein